MYKALWVTDPHLDFLKEDEVLRFYKQIAGENPDCILLGGDISIATRLQHHLELLEQAVKKPIYYVLGNHDFYRGDIESVRGIARKLTPHLRWLGSTGIVKLTPNTCLIGHDGWGDARLGDFDGSDVRLNDIVYFDELSEFEEYELRSMFEICYFIFTSLLNWIGSSIIHLNPKYSAALSGTQPKRREVL
jgi:Icc protein